MIVPNEPVTRLRRSVTGQDRYGNPTYSESTEDLPPAFFAPSGDLSVESGREPVVSLPTLYWRGVWPDVVAADRLTVRGVTYTVEGEPADWRGASVGGLVVKLRDTREQSE